MSFVKRPVAVFTMAYFVLFCVMASADSLRSAAAVIMTGALFALFLFLSFVTEDKVRVATRYVCIALAGATVAVSYAAAFFSKVTNEYAYLAGERHTIVGTVDSVMWESGYRRCYLLDVSSVDGKDASFGVALVTPRYPSVGDIIKTEADLSQIENGDDFDSKKYYLSNGAVLMAECDTVYKTGDSASFKSAAARLRETLSRTLHGKTSDASADVADAVLLGNRIHLSRENKDTFSKIGISHLVAISGMHVSFVCAALFFILSRFGVGRRFGAVVAIPAVVFYMFLTGLSPSVVRASVIACILMASRLLRRTYDEATALSVCGAAMVTLDPYVALNVSMQLSFLAYVGCLAGVSVLKRAPALTPEKGANILKRTVFFVVRSVVFTGVIVLTSLPVMLLHFDSVSLLSPLSNLIFIPAFSVILYLAALVIIFSPIAPVYSALSFVSDKFTGLVMSAARAMAKIPGSKVSLAYPFSPPLVILMCAATFTFVFAKNKKIRIAAVTVLAVSAASYAVGVILAGA